MKIERALYKVVVLWMVLFAPFTFHLSPLSAQNMTSSPYSRYAYGDMNENVPVAFRSMGGVGLGMRNNRAINPSQPASYTSCDSLTFMFDVAASASWSRYRDARGMKNKANGNLEYVTMQFPLFKRWIAMSVGLLPYSSVGYDISLNDSIPGYHFVKNYTGEGNISQVYGGLSFNIMNWFALGANVYYMWGNLSHMRALTFTEAANPTMQYEMLSVSNVRVRAGAQFFHTWNKHTINLGAVFEPRMKLNSDLYIYESQTNDTIYVFQNGWQLPMVWGVGASYNWDSRLTVAFDFERQCMGEALYNGLPGNDPINGLQNRNRYALGFEYRHDAMGRKYAERMLWRAGVSVQDEYLASIGAKKITAAIGIGFPLWTIGTVINLGVEYNHRGSAAGLQDNSFRFTIGASIAENWFFKRKL